MNGTRLTTVFFLGSEVFKPKYSSEGLLSSTWELCLLELTCKYGMFAFSRFLARLYEVLLNKQDSIIVNNLKGLLPTSTKIITLWLKWFRLAQRPFRYQEVSFNSQGFIKRCRWTNWPPVDFILPTLKRQHFAPNGCLLCAVYTSMTVATASLLTELAVQLAGHPGECWKRF